MSRTRLLTIVALVLAAAGIAAYQLTADKAEPAHDMAAMNAGSGIVEVALPDSLSPTAEIGAKAFAARCAACHGQNGSGNDGMGPPLIHIIYEPSHHGDESFQRAVAMGVQAHHWRFGNMPAQPGLSRADVGYIIAYVRELQRANGIN